MTSAGYGVCPLDKLVAAVFQWSRIGLRLPRPIDRKCPPEHSQPRHGGEHAERIPRRSQAVRRIDPARGAATRRPECVRPVDAPTAAASARASRKRACRAGCDPGPCEVLHRPVPHGRPAAAFDLGPQTGCARGGPRGIQAHRHQRAGLATLRADAAHRPAGRQDLRLAGHGQRRQRPLVQRLLHADRPSASAEEFRERQPRPAQ